MRSTAPSVFSGFLVIVLMSPIVGGAESARGGVYVKNYISWEDLHVRGGLSSRDDSNGTRIIVVDQNGTGDSRTVQGAVDMVPHQNYQRVKIYILPGTYREKVHVPRTKPYISFIGTDKRASNTVISWNNKASDKDENGNELGTFRTGTVTVESDYFCATGITFENNVNAAPGDTGRQAVALHIAGDKAMFYRVTITGAQDTLLDDAGSHYFYQCHILGTVDFIFGTARSLYENCMITSTAERYGAIAAHHRNSPDDNTGFSFIRCVINGSGKILLGRAWGTYSRVIYSYCNIADMIAPEGWGDWNDPSRRRTVVFGEYNCRGDGAKTAGRVSWAKTLTTEEVRPFVGLKFIDGQQWLNL